MACQPLETCFHQWDYLYVVHFKIVTEIQNTVKYSALNEEMEIPTKHVSKLCYRGVDTIESTHMLVFHYQWRDNHSSVCYILVR